MCNRVAEGVPNSENVELPVKRPTTFKEQVELIKNKGFIVEDEEECIAFLQKANYYRFSAYFLPFRNTDGSYLNGIKFEQIKRIYEFDCRLRSTLLQCTEEIELYLRTQFAYYSAHHHGALGYMNKDIYVKQHNHEKFLELIDKCIKKNEETAVVIHHKKQYGGKFPIWVIIEYFTMGMLSRFYSDLKTPDQKALARSMYNTTPAYLQSWLVCLTNLRNRCAHYSRIYFWSFSALPKFPKNVQCDDKYHLFAQVMVLKFLYPDKEKWVKGPLAEIKQLIGEYREDISLKHIGFPEDWEARLS